MYKELKASLWLRAFDWDLESTRLVIFYRNRNVITFYNVSEETAEKFINAIFKFRYIQVMKRNPAVPFNFAEKRPSK
jgi:hypothetical protein